MRNDQVNCAGLLSALFLLACGNWTRAQTTSIVLTNASVRGSDFSFKIVASDLSACVIESANAPNGVWAQLSVPVASPFVVRVDPDARFFRVRCGNSFSANLAGYVSRIIPDNLSLVANPLNHGANTVVELFANPPPRTVLYKYDAARQVWGAVTEFEFEAWSSPVETLSPGEGAYLYSAFPFRQVFSGLMSNDVVFPQLKGGWNLVSLPAPSNSLLPQPKPGDTIFEYDQVTRTFFTRPRDFGAWSEEPTLDWRESFWYYRDEPNPEALPPQGALHFNNYAPSIDAPFAGPDGKWLEGTNWLGQLYASNSQAGEFSAIGAPLPFLTGGGSGYLDTSSGALRMIPFAAPGDTVWVQARMWESGAGSSFEEAVAHGGAHGTSPIVSAVSGGGGTNYLPMLPTIADFNPSMRPPDGNAWPTNQLVFAGGKARFSAQKTPGVSYQWQRLVKATNWVDITDARSYELVFDPVALQNEGSYRLQTSYEGVTSSGRPVHLRVLPAAQFAALTYVPSSGTFQFKLETEAGFNYRLEASADLTNWLYLSTLDNFGGSQPIADTEAGSFRQRFYRLVIAGP